MALFLFHGLMVTISTILLPLLFLSFFSLPSFPFFFSVSLFFTPYLSLFFLPDFRPISVHFQSHSVRLERKRRRDIFLHSFSREQKFDVMFLILGKVLFWKFCSLQSPQFNTWYFIQVLPWGQFLLFAENLIWFFLLVGREKRRKRERERKKEDCDPQQKKSCQTLLFCYTTTTPISSSLSFPSFLPLSFFLFLTLSIFWSMALTPKIFTSCWVGSTFSPLLIQ